MKHSKILFFVLAICLAVFTSCQTCHHGDAPLLYVMEIVGDETSCEFVYKSPIEQGVDYEGYDTIPYAPNQLNCGKVLIGVPGCESTVHFNRTEGNGTCTLYIKKSSPEDTTPWNGDTLNEEEIEAIVKDVKENGDYKIVIDGRDSTKKLKFRW